MNDTTKNVHVWAPELFCSTGGIQTFSRHFINALSDVLPAAEIRLLLKNDLPEAVCNYNGFRQVTAFGQWRPSLRTPRFASECLRQALCEQPRLIISTHLNFGPVAQIVRKLIAVPYVLVAHGIDAWDLNVRTRRKALQNADLILAVSRYTRERLLENSGFDPRRVQILPNTFSPDRFTIGAKSTRLLKKHGLSPQTPVILTVCRLAGEERYKGYDQMIRALPEILRAVPDARYLLVGGGHDHSRIAKLVAELGVQKSVVFAGFVSNTALPEYYNLCDLFAMPSKGEGFGIVYLEALASGKPVLAGNKDGSRDALADGELGILVDPNDTAEIASETIRVLRRQHPHPNLFRPELLRRRVAELFGFESFKRTLAERLRPLVTTGHYNQFEQIAD